MEEDLERAALIPPSRDSTEEMARRDRQRPDQVEMSSRKASLRVFFHKRPSLLISLIALFVSITSFSLGELRSWQEDRRANRREVRSIIQRLTKLPIENFELLERNESSPNAQALTSMITQEIVLLASQAAELIDRYPDSFTSTEYAAVAYSLSSSNLMARVPAMYERAIASAMNSNDYIVANRGLGSFLYSQGAHSEARARYSAAVDAWKRFPERNPTTVNFYDFLTYLHWARSAFAAGQEVEAREYLSNAQVLLSRLPIESKAELQGQVDSLQEMIQSR